MSGTENPDTCLDAARYRWLRKNAEVALDDIGHGPRVFVMWYTGIELGAEFSLDQAVDAEMAAGDGA